MKISSIQVVMLVMFAVVDIDNASACSCPGSDLETQFKQADVVFKGRVKKINDLKFKKPVGEKVVTLQVSQKWKGKVSSQIVVKTLSLSTMCGFWFAVDEEYIVFAKKSDHIFSTDVCSGTMSAAEAVDTELWLKRHSAQH